MAQQACIHYEKAPFLPVHKAYVLDPTDPFVNGFTIGDIWA